MKAILREHSKSSLASVRRNIEFYTGRNPRLSQPPGTLEKRSARNVTETRLTRWTPQVTDEREDGPSVLRLHSLLSDFAILFVRAGLMEGL